MTSRINRALQLHGWAVLAIVALTLAWFTPVLMTGKVFFSDNHMPGFFLPVQVWSDLLYSGFPLLLDQTYANPYPVRIVLSSMADLIGRASAYNLYIWLAYAIAGLGTYTYVYSLVANRFASVTAGCAFAFSGFLQSHVGHDTIIHTAAWLPWVVWATHRVVLHGSGRDMGFLAIFGALSYLGSHPQITFQIGVVSVLYGVALAAGRPRWWSAIARFGASWVVGIALVAWLIVPGWGHASESMRGVVPTIPTLDGALPLDQVIQTIFPWVYGAFPPSVVGPIARFGNQFFVEIITYVAAPILFLAALGAIAGWSARSVKFWVLAGLLFFVLVLGPVTLIGEMRFHAPVFNLFAIPSRDILTVHFATCALAGVGVEFLAARRVGRWQFVAAMSAGAVMILAALLFYPVASRKAAEAGITLPRVWANVAIIIPLALAIISALAIALAWRSPSRTTLLGVAGTALIACGYFGWYAPWRLVSGMASTALDMPPVVRQLLEADAGKPGRVIAADGWLGPAGISPNSSMLWGLPNVTGYGPLLNRQYADFLRLTNGGWLRPDNFLADSIELDLLNTRWLHAGKALPEAPKPVSAFGMDWSPATLGRSIGGTCGGKQEAPSATFLLPRKVDVTRIGVVSTLGCGLEVPQGTHMATVTIDSGGSEPRRFALLAGQDTAEWSAACVDDKAKVLHRSAPVFNRSPVPTAGASCMGQRYLADKSIDPGPASRITIDWAPEVAVRYPKTSMRIDYISAADPKGQSTVIEAGNVLSPGRWKRREFEGGLVLFENLRAMPQAWLVDRAVSLGSVADEVAAIRSGLLPAKDLFDPASVLVTSDKRIPSGHLARRAEKASQASVQVAEWAGPTKKFLVESPTPRWLVVSNQYAPGWAATLNGADVDVFRVNAVLQGVWLPAGKHVVEFKYLPRHFALLLCVAALCLALIGWLLFRPGGLPAWLGVRSD